MQLGQKTKAYYFSSRLWLHPLSVKELKYLTLSKEHPTTPFWSFLTHLHFSRYIFKLLHVSFYDKKVCFGSLNILQMHRSAAPTL